MFCPKCGKQIQDGTNYCKYCGENLSNLVSSPTQQNMNITAIIPNQHSKNNRNKVLPFIIAPIAIVLAIGLFVGAKKVLQHNFNSEKPAIQITNIQFDTSTSSVSFEFENISDKDISYIEFDTRYYDRMGKLLLNGYDTESMTFKYTGPLYKGRHDSCNASFVFAMPSNAAVVYPNVITVTFFDDKQVTFENSIYAYTEEYYGGELKE